MPLMEFNHNPRKFQRSYWVGVGLFVTGLVLLAAAGAYYGYGFLATRDMSNMIAGGARAETLTLSSPTPSQQPLFALGELHPGSLLPARQWANPRGTLNLEQPDLKGFTPLSDQGQPVISGSVGRAERLIVPQLNINVAVTELAISNLALSDEYETPKFTVGHMPASPNPGSTGNGWYFGHLESPVQGEGNVFSRLPTVPDLLRDGEDLHVILRSGNREYLYLASETHLLHESDLSLYDSEDSRVTLVTCFPRLHYDHRLLVTARLIGFRDTASS